MLSRFSHRSYSSRETSAFAGICGDLIAIGTVRASARHSAKEATYEHMSSPTLGLDDLALGCVVHR